MTTSHIFTEFGFVKSVLSGDTLVLMGNVKSGPPPEIQVSLSSLQAPRVARRPGATDEVWIPVLVLRVAYSFQPWAFASREFLRNLCIGKQVQFQIEYKVESINRIFAAVYLDGENLCKTVARNGWARVLPPEQSKSGKSQVCCTLRELFLFTLRFRITKSY